MSYSIIQPPFTLKFHEMSRDELEPYRVWFHDVLPERLAELTKEVNRTSGFENWKPDLTPQSLGSLGEWFACQVQTRHSTSQEIEEIKSSLLFPIDVAGEELTNRTFSLAMDIGMYLGQVVHQNVAGAWWDQPLNNEKFADYGQPVIIGLAMGTPLNPVRIAVNLAYGIARKQQDGRRLRELYDIWVCPSPKSFRILTDKSVE